MTAQLDLFNPASTLTSRSVPGQGTLIESVGGYWRAHWYRWGWCLYRQTIDGVWESWEPDLPYGQAYVTERVDAEQHLEAAIAQHGDRPLMVGV